MNSNESSEQVGAEVKGPWQFAHLDVVWPDRELGGTSPPSVSTEDSNPAFSAKYLDV